MKYKINYKNLILILLPVLVVVLLVLSKPGPMQIVNVHESIESKAEVVKLQEVMKNLGIEQIVLQAIPEDLVKFDGTTLDLGGVAENNAALSEAVKTYPDQFSFFCSIDPNDLLRNDQLEDCLSAGAIGVKLYNGYSYGHQTPIDDAKLSSFYALLAEKDAILMLPVNTEKYENELKNLLTLNPDLTVICPHFCLSSKNLGRLTELMTSFPNLYVDTSFGNIDFVEDGFKIISENHDEYETFFTAFQDRILFGTDAVITSYEGKDIEWTTKLYSDYLSILQDGDFESALLSGTSYKGLQLSDSIQRKVFSENWRTLIK